jgi:peptidoglycan/LPS O-acetylase OafA/YrhL
MSTVDHTAGTRPAAAARRTGDALHHRQVSLVLVAAFLLSAIHTIYAWRTGLADPGFTVTTPTTYAFYALGFGAAALARRPERAARLVLLAYLLVVLALSVFYYPTTFEPRQQTTFGWFENDVYVGLLCVATYLTAAGLAGVRLRRSM